MLHLKERLIIFSFSGVTVENLNIPFSKATIHNSLNMSETSQDSAANVTSAVGGKW